MQSLHLISFDIPGNCIWDFFGCTIKNTQDCCNIRFRKCCEHINLGKVPQHKPAPMTTDSKDI